MSALKAYCIMDDGEVCIDLVTIEGSPARVLLVFAEKETAERLCKSMKGDHNYVEARYLIDSEGGNSFEILDPT